MLCQWLGQNRGAADGWGNCILTSNQDQYCSVGFAKSQSRETITYKEKLNNRHNVYVDCPGILLRVLIDLR